MARGPKGQKRPADTVAKAMGVAKIVIEPGWKPSTEWGFGFEDRVRKTKGSSWQGRVCGFYSTSITPRGYAVESEREPGSVQIYPEAALEVVTE